MSKWIAEFELEDGDSMPEHMDLNFLGARLDFHCKPVSDCIPIPENATNGDVIEALFPNFEVKIIGDTVIMETHFPFCKMRFDIKYWNAKYKPGLQ